MRRAKFHPTSASANPKLQSARRNWINALHLRFGIALCNKGGDLGCDLYWSNPDRPGGGIECYYATRMPAVQVIADNAADFLETLCAARCAFAHADNASSYRLHLSPDPTIQVAQQLVDPPRSRRTASSMLGVFDALVRWYRPRLTSNWFRSAYDVAKFNIAHDPELDMMPAREVDAARQFLATFFAQNSIERPSDSPRWLKVRA